MLGRTALRQPPLLPKGLPRARPRASGDPKPLPIPRPENEAARGAIERPRADTQPTSGVIRFLLFLSVACAVTCVYVWQVSEVQNLRRQTVKLEAELDRIEEENVSLMLELVPLESPAYVEAQADSLALGRGRAPIPVVLAPEHLASAQAESEAANASVTSGSVFGDDGPEMLPVAAVQSLTDRLSLLVRDARSFVSSLRARTEKALAALSPTSLAP